MTMQYFVKHKKIQFIMQLNFERGSKKAKLVNALSKGAEIFGRFFWRCTQQIISKATLHCAGTFFIFTTYIISRINKYKNIFFLYSSFTELSNTKEFSENLLCQSQLTQGQLSQPDLLLILLLPLQKYKSLTIWVQIALIFKGKKPHIQM